MDSCHQLEGVITTCSRWPPSARAGDTLALEELTCPPAHLSSMSSGANVISVRIDVHDRGSEVAKAVGVFGLPEGSPYRVEVLGN